MNIFILGFYTLGTLLLPMGNFSALLDLPEMYRHCKATEDKDMTPFDFLSDHLFNVDCLFDNHDNGDEQKPHTPIQYHHQDIQSYFVSQWLNVILNNNTVIQSELPIYNANIHGSNYLSLLFRPPIV